MSFYPTSEIIARNRHIGSEMSMISNMLSSGIDTRSAARNTLVSSFDRSVKALSSYYINTQIARNTVDTVRVKLENIKAKLLEAKELAVNARSASSSNLTSLNEAYRRLVINISNSVENAGIRDNKLFTADSSDKSYSVGPNTKISADINASGTTPLFEKVVAGVTLLAPGSGSIDVNTDGAKLQITVDGVAEVGGPAGVAASTTVTDRVNVTSSTIKLISGTMKIELNSDVYFFNQPNQIVQLNLTNNAFLEFTSDSGETPDFTVAAPRLYSGGTFVGTRTDDPVAGTVQQLGIENLAASSNTLIESNFGKSNISSSESASKADSMVDEVLDALESVMGKIGTSDSLLTRQVTVLHDDIKTSATTKEELSSADIIDGMAKLKNLQSSAQFNMITWQLRESVGQDAISVLRSMTR